MPNNITRLTKPFTLFLMLLISALAANLSIAKSPIPPKTPPATQPAADHGPMPSVGESFKLPIPARRLSNDGLPREDMPAVEQEQPKHGTSGKSSKAEATTKPSNDVVPWTLAGKHVDETITVEGKIVDTHNTGKFCFLNFSNDKTGFYVIIYQEAYSGLPNSPQTYYLNKTIRAAGKVYQHDDRTQIRVQNPEQIKVVD